MRALLVVTVLLGGVAFAQDKPAAAPATDKAPAAAAAPAQAAPAPAAVPAAELAAGEVPLRAPMPGMIISYSVKVGDKVNTGDLVCVLEAMKMQNSLPAPAAGTIKAINFEPGSRIVAMSFCEPRS